MKLPTKICSYGSLCARLWHTRTLLFVAGALWFDPYLRLCTSQARKQKVSVDDDIRLPLDDKRRSARLGRHRALTLTLFSPCVASCAPRAHHFLGFPQFVEYIILYFYGKGNPKEHRSVRGQRYAAPMFFAYLVSLIARRVSRECILRINVQVLVLEELRNVKITDTWQTSPCFVF